MLPNQVLAAKVTSGVVTILGQFTERIRVTSMRLIGTTLATAIRVGEYADYLTLENKDGLIALDIPANIRFGDGRGSWSERGLRCFVEVKDGLVVTDQLWTPSPQRCLVSFEYQPSHGHALKVQIGEQVYISIQRFTEKEPTYRYVDGNTLCKFIYGEIEIEDVELVATAHVEEMKARDELPGVKNQLEKLEQELGEAKQRLENREKTLNKVGREKLDEAGKRAHFQRCVDRVREVVGEKIFLGPFALKKIREQVGINPPKEDTFEVQTEDNQL